MGSNVQCSGGSGEPANARMEKEKMCGEDKGRELKGRCTAWIHSQTMGPPWEKTPEAGRERGVRRGGEGRRRR